MDKIEIKRILHAAVIEELNDRIATESAIIESCRDSANSDTKSSAGDKYETNRAMMHLEQEKFSEQLNDTLELKKRAQLISVDKIYGTAQPGAVVETSVGLFFIVVSADDIEIDDVEYTPISLSSPIGESVKGKTKGETTEFRGKLISIYDVY